MLEVSLEPGLLSILTRLPDAVLVADDERRYVFANEAAAALLETPVDQLIGMQIDDFAVEAPRVETDWRSFIDEGSQKGPFRLQTRTGAIRYVYFTAVANVSPGFHFSLLRDVTEEHERDLHRRQLQQLAEQALDAAQMGCWHWSILSQQTTCNDGFKRLFGVQPDVSLPPYSEFLKRIHPDDLGAVTEQLGRTLQAGERYEMRYRVVCRDGSVRWILDRGEVLFDRDRKRIGISGVAWDVTKQRVLEQEHANHVRDLARSNQDLQRFAHVASHDLKEPLRNVCALSELLSRQATGKLSDDEREVLEMIIGSARRMATLIDGMLAYAKMGLKRDLTLRPEPSTEIIQDALSNLRLVIEQAGANVEVSSDLPIVSCARSDLLQVFQNLIGNAIKYCDGPAQVNVRAEQDGETWRFAVQDNGIGISPEHQESIFEMFARLHKDAYPGTGAGLAICKAIVEKHGGRIWVESEPGRGSTFFFTIPC